MVVSRGCLCFYSCRASLIYVFPNRTYEAITQSFTPVLVSREELQRVLEVTKSRSLGCDCDGPLDALLFFFALPSAALGLGVRDIFANGSFTRFWRCYIVIMERASWSGAAPNEAFIF